MSVAHAHTGCSKFDAEFLGNYGREELTISWGRMIDGYENLIIFMVFIIYHDSLHINGPR